MTAGTTRHNAPLSFYIALDGPSALSLYRDRDELIASEADSQLSVPSNHSQARRKTQIPSSTDHEDAYLSDEDMALTLASTNIFGHRPICDLTDEGEEQAGIPRLTRSQIRSFARCSTKASLLKLIPYEDIGLQPPSANSPLYIIAPSIESRRRVRHIQQRACASELPSYSLRRLGKHVLVPTPELTFLLLAKHLSLVELIMAGMELCGRYRMVGATTRHPVSSKRTIYNCDPFTTPANLQTFLDRVEVFPGKSVAMRACKYLAPNSSSPMESIIYLLLCMPRQMGGYGLPRPLLNAKRAVNKQAESFTLATTLIPDLYWPEGHLDMEYDSDEFHSDEQSLQKGARRTLALRAMHVDVISMTSDMVHDEEAFGAAARLVARHLNARIRPTDDKLSERRRALRDALLE